MMRAKVRELKFPNTDEQATAQYYAVNIEIIKRTPVLAGVLSTRWF